MKVVCISVTEANANNGAYFINFYKWVSRVVFRTENQVELIQIRSRTYCDECQNKSEIDCPQKLITKH